MEYSPKSIAENIFSNDPSEPNTNQLILEEGDNEFVFEILVNILLEGLKLKNYFNLEILKNSKIKNFVELVSNNYILNINEKDTINLYKYFLSLGFIIKIEVINYNEYIKLTNENYKNRYCSILPIPLLKEEKVYDINYRFIKSRNFKFDENKNDWKYLDKWTTTFIDFDKLYVISFKYNR